MAKETVLNVTCDVCGSVAAADDVDVSVFYDGSINEYGTFNKDTKHPKFRIKNHTLDFCNACVTLLTYQSLHYRDIFFSKPEYYFISKEES